MKRGKGVRAECRHEPTVTVRNSGIERTVCEQCGHVSIRALDELTGEVSRRQFERQIERAS